MSSRLIHINGAPGVGKLTIARHLGQRLNARVLDNHAIYNVAFSLRKFQTPEFFDAVRAVREVSYDQILRLPKHEIVILTDALFDDSDWAEESWKAIEKLGAARGILLSIALMCEPDEHRRRIVALDRVLRGKLVDADHVEKFSERRLLERGGDRSFTLDITNLRPDEAAAKIETWVRRVGN